MYEKSKPACGKLLFIFKSMSAKLDVECPLSDLKLYMFKTSAKSPKFKMGAADGRHTLHILRFILNEVFDRASVHNQLRYGCTMHLDMCYQEIRHWSPDTSPGVVKDCGIKALISYGELSRLSILGGDTYSMFWRIYPKFHLFTHCLANANDNPSDSWNYYDEHQIGEAAGICEQLHVNNIHRSLLDRWRISRQNCK